MEDAVATPGEAVHERRVADVPAVEFQPPRRRGLGEGVLGVRAVLDASRGDQPFYLRPFVGLRGVPAMRYAGESVVSMELEHRWPVGERWDLIAFAGVLKGKGQ